MPINTGLWTAWGTGTQVQAGGTLQQSATGTAGQYIGVVSVAAYDLTNRAVQIQITQLPSATTGSQAYLRTEIDANNAVIIGYGDGALFCQHQLSGTTTTVSSQAWTANTLGFRLVFDNAQNLVWFDTYVQGSGWVNRYSEAIPIATTALHVTIGTGCYQAVASPGTTLWEGVNLPITWKVTGLSVGQSTSTAGLRAALTGTTTTQVASTATLISATALSGTVVAQAAFDEVPPAPTLRLSGASVGLVCDTGSSTVRLSGTTVAQAIGSGVLGFAFALTGTMAGQAAFDEIPPAPTLRLTGAAVGQAAFDEIPPAPTLKLTGSTVAQASSTNSLRLALDDGPTNGSVGQGGASGSLGFQRAPWPPFRYTGILGTFYSRLGRVELGAPLLVANTVSFIGQTSGRASSSAKLRLQLAPVSVVGQGSTSGSTRLTLAAPVPIVAQASSTAGLLIKLTGQPTGQASSGISLTVGQPVSGAITGQGATTGALSLALTGALVGQGSTTGPLRLLLTGVIAGQAALDELAAAPTI